MKPTTALVALAPLLLAAPSLRTASAPRDEGAAVQVAGLLVQRPLTRAGDWGPDMPFMGSQGSVRVVLEVDLARVEDAGERRVVDLLREQSRVARFVDDRGTDLSAGFDEHFGAFEMMPALSGDQLRIAATVASETAPAAGATRLELEGTLALFCASRKELAESEVAALEEGAELNAGGLAFEVVATGAPDWGDAAWSITLRTRGKVAHVTSWWLVTPEGEAVALDLSMTGRMNQVTEVTLNAPKALERGRLRLERWADGATLELPFAVKAGVGL